MADLRIREIGGEEFELAWPIFREVACQRRDLYLSRATSRRKRPARCGRTRRPRCFIAESDGHVVGCYRLAPNQMGPGSHVANGSYMVASDARGHGIGAALCAHSIEEARRSGFLAMQFNIVVSTIVRRCACGNARLRDRRHAAERLSHGGTPVDAYVMYRTL